MSAARQPRGFGYTFISSFPTAVHGSQGCTQEGALGFPRALHLVTWAASEEAEHLLGFLVGKFTSASLL